MSDTDALTLGAEAATDWLNQHVSRWHLDCPGDPEELTRDVLSAAGWLPDDAQPTPARTDAVDGAHDRAIAWMVNAPGYRYHRERGEIQSVVDGLTARKAFGLRKYGTTLNPDDRRDPLADTLDEVLDAIAYAQVGFEQALAANDEHRRSFWWLRRSRLTDEAIELYRERRYLAGQWAERVDAVGEGSNQGDEAALAVRADRSEA